LEKEVSESKETSKKTKSEKDNEEEESNQGMDEIERSMLNTPDK